MKVRLNELLLLNILIILLIIIITFFPSSALRIILGLLLALFFPGYAFIAALFPRRGSLGGIERTALSFGLSIAIVALISLILNYTHWGIKIYPVLISLTVFTIITSLIAWFRRRRLGEAERFAVSCKLYLPSWNMPSFADKVLSIVLVVVILGTIGTLAYIFVVPRTGETFTEFYILGSEGKIGDYPTEVKVEEEARVRVVIVNYENEDVSYLVEVTVNGIKNNEIGPIALGHGDEWMGETGFTMVTPGENQRVEFALYKNGQSKPYQRPLLLWVDAVR